MYYIKVSAVGCSGDSANRRRKNKVFLNTKFSVYLYMKMCYTVTIIKKGDITVWQI